MIPYIYTLDIADLMSTILYVPHLYICAVCVYILCMSVCGRKAKYIAVAIVLGIVMCRCLRSCTHTDTLGSTDIDKSRESTTTNNHTRVLTRSHLRVQTTRIIAHKKQWKGKERQYTY